MIAIIALEFLDAYAYSGRILRCILTGYPRRFEMCSGTLLGGNL